MATTPFIKQLERMAEEHRAIVRAAETLLALVRQRPAKGAAVPAALTAALALDTTRRRGRPRKAAARPAATNGSGRYLSQKEQKQKRARQRLARFSTTEPRPGGQGVQIYAYHGYLKRTPSGLYLRTDKPYAP